ncbi:MAG: DNA-methyltransferase [Promethearchaeota archaeon]
MVEKERKKKTRTSAFGVSKRESHDSSRFYDSDLYKNLKKPQKPQNVEFIDNSMKLSPNDVLDNIILGDSRNMELIPDCSVHLMITSPPYNVTKEYDDNLTLKKYLDLLKGVFSEVHRVLVPGGRAAINVANIGRKPYIPLHTYIIEIMQKIGFHMRGEIIWDKGASAGVSCAWGSFASASNPVLRDIHEYILIFSKLTNRLEKRNKENTIHNDDFVQWSKSIWSFPAVSAKKIGHPAPFPEELPRRLIEFYSYKGDIILDPFIGSGTTALAAYHLKRHFIGYEISSDYFNLAKRRILEVKTQKKIDNYL